MLYILISWIFYPMYFLSALLRRRGPVQRILVIQTAKIGDLVCSTPVLRALHRRFPSARIVVLADPASCPILEANPMVDAIMPRRAGDLRGFGRKFAVAVALSRQRFDLSVALLPSVATSIIPLWAFIPWRFSVGPDRPGISFRLAALFNNCVVWHERTRSILDTYAELLNRSMGIPVTPESTRLELPFTREAGRKAASLLEKAGLKKTDLVIGMAPAARNKIKEVPPPLYAEVADGVIEKLGARVVLTGSEEDREAVDAVLSAMKHRDRVVDASGALKLAELPALIAEFDLFLSVDSGPVYMAIALGVPSINLAGPCAMDERPLGPLTTVIQKDLPCAPCSYTFSTATTCRTGKRECVTTLTAGPIIEAALKLLARTQKKVEKTGQTETGQPPSGDGARGGR